MIGSLAVTEVGRDTLGRPVTVQRYRGSGPVAAGDSYAVMVQVPDSVTAAGRIYVRNEVAGELNVITPARGRRRGQFELVLLGGPSLGITEGTRDGLAIELADRWADQ